MSDELTPGPLTPSGPIIIKTELPGHLEVVTKIDGEELSVVAKRLDDERARLSYLTQSEKKDALEAEAEVDELELEKKERDKGNTPLRLIAKYRKQIGLWGAIGAAGVVVSKVAGCF